MANSLRATPEGLAIVDQARRRRGWTKTSTARWWQDAHTSRATLRRFWQGERIQQDIFIAICHAVGISYWKSIAEVGDDSDSDLPSSWLPPHSARLSAHVEASLLTPHLDLSEAPDVETFYGRTQELHQLEQWLVTDRCKFVAIVGMGGIGKTALALALTDSIQQKFECLIWRSLQRAPSLSQLQERFLSVFNQTCSQNDQQGWLQLRHHLQQRRCLIVLDGLDRVQTQAADDYIRFVQQWMSDRHQSCLVITSREQLPASEFTTAKARCLVLQGLQNEPALELLTAAGLGDKTLGRSTLIRLYRGNPLALKVAISLIQSVFGGNVAAFLSQNALVMDDRLHTMLQQQIDQLSDLEREILYWLAIWQEPVAFSRLQTHLLVSPDAAAVLQAIATLKRRSLLENWFSTDDASFTLQPMVLQVVTDALVNQAAQEIRQVSQSANLCDFKVLRDHWLLRPGSDDILGDRILTLLREQLWRIFGPALPQVLYQILPLLKGQPPLAIGYVGSNVMAVLKQIDLTAQLPNTIG